MFKLRINTANAAFHDTAGDMPDVYAKRGEVRRILYRVIEDIAIGKSEGSCVDMNGNIVGTWHLD